MVEFVMYIGLSGSGKSTLAKQYAEENTTENRKWAYMSSDNVRKLLYGDENCQDNPAMVFEYLNKATIECLLAGVNVVYDATNLSAKRRKALIARIRSACYDTVIHFAAIVVATPVGCCIERDKNRDRRVGERVILKQLCSFQVPTAHEGWNYIELLHNCDDYVRDNHAVDYIFSATEMTHDNPHHLDTVWQHSVCVADTMQKKVEDCEDGYLVTEPIDLVRSIGLLHDIGKVFTKTYDENGVAHYNGHDNASAYLSLFYPAHFSNSHILLRAAVIGWHMRHFSFQTKQGFENWKLTLTPSECSLLGLLIDADTENSIP
jgi:predicted kinase